MIDILRPDTEILLVEDNPGDVRLFTEIMKDSKVKIDNVGTLADSLIKVRENKYDVVLLDLGLPDSNGVDTFKQFTDGGLNLPVVVFTGNDDNELGNSLIKLGAQDFLVKGRFDEYVLQKSIAYSIDRYEAKQTIFKKEAKFRQLIDQNADGMIVLDEEDRVIYLNGAAEKLLGRKSDNIVGEHFQVIEDEDGLTELYVLTPAQKYNTIQINLFNSVWENQPVKVASLRDITELRLNQDRVNHLNQLLKTIGSINHLIVSEKTAEELLQKTVDLMTSGKNYTSAWIGLINEEDKLTNIFQSGMTKYLNSLEEILSDCEKTRCIEQTINSKLIVETIDTEITCTDCPLKYPHENNGMIAVRIPHENKTYGMMVIARSQYLESNEEEEKKLLAEIAADLGLALHSFEMKSSKLEAERKLVESERFVRSTLDSIHKNIAVLNQQGEIIAVNKAWNQFAEENDADLAAVSTGVNYLDVCKRSAERGDETAALVCEKIVEIINGESEKYSLEYPCHSPNTKRWFNLSINRFKGEGPTRLVVTHDNITTLKMASMRIVESERKYRGLVESSTDGIFVESFEGEILDCNRAGCEMFGYTKEEITSLKIKDLVPEKFAAKVPDKLTEADLTNGTYVERVNKKKDGTIFPTEVSTIAFEEEGDRKIIAYVRDISARKKAEEAEEKNRKVAQALYEMSKTIELPEEEIMQNALELSVKFTESEGGYLHFMNSDDVSLNLFKWSESVNKICKAEKIDHYPLEEAGIWADCVRKREPVIHNDYQSERERKGLPEGHFTVKRHMSVPIFEGDKIVAVTGVGNKEKEYTENDTLTLSLFMSEMWKLIQRKRTADKIKESEERYRSLYENATIGIYRTTWDGELIMANPAFLKMLGLSSIDKLRNKNVSELYNKKEELHEFRRRLKENEIVRGFESELLTADGRIITIKESAKFIDTESDENIIEGVVEDITKAKEAERELLLAKDKAVAMEKIKSEFLAQMSHEIRTPLNAMLSAVSFIEDEVVENAPEDIKDTFSIVNSSGQRIINTIQSILNMSELQAGTYEIVKNQFDIYREIIDPTTAKYTKELQQKKITLEKEITADSTKVILDWYSVSEIFTNVFDNAVKYTKEGKISISLATESNNLILKISDTGIGISEDYLRNIFEPFSQESQGYSRPYDGCGLGLALTKKYCELNNGDINIESVRGAGTTVTVSFPLSD